MNRHPKKAKKQRRTVRPWTYDRAKAALPYLRSVVRSVRDHRLQVQGHDLRATRLAERSGRPDCEALIARAEAARAADRAQEAFDDALHELNRLDVYCLDPISGLAFIPFLHKDQLAWFLFDLFGENLLDSWRYHEDPLEIRRPISEVAAPPSEAPLSV